MGSVRGTVVWGILWRTVHEHPPLKLPPGAGCTMDLCDRELTYSKVSKQGFQKMCLFFCSAAPVVAVVVVVVLVVFFQELRNHTRVKQLCS